MPAPPYASGARQQWPRRGGVSQPGARPRAPRAGRCRRHQLRGDWRGDRRRAGARAAASPTMSRPHSICRCRPTGMRTAQLAQFAYLLLNPGPHRPRRAVRHLGWTQRPAASTPARTVAIAAAINIGCDDRHAVRRRRAELPRAEHGQSRLDARRRRAARRCPALSCCSTPRSREQLDARADCRRSPSRRSTPSISSTWWSLRPGPTDSPTWKTSATRGRCSGSGDGPRTVCQTPNSFLFWDQSHPTTAAHALLGAAFADAVQPDAVPEPATMTLTGLGIAAGLLRRRRAA